MIRSLAIFSMAAALLIPQFALAKLPNADDSIGATQVLYERTAIGDISATMVIEGQYIIAWWAAGAEHPGGCALLKKVHGAWTVVKMGTGKLVNVAVLEGLGVPANEAKALVADVNVPGGGSTPSP